MSSTGVLLLSKFHFPRCFRYEKPSMINASLVHAIFIPSSKLEVYIAAFDFRILFLTAHNSSSVSTAERSVSINIHAGPRVHVHRLDCDISFHDTQDTSKRARVASTGRQITPAISRYFSGVVSESPMCEGNCRLGDRDANLFSRKIT